MGMVVSHGLIGVGALGIGEHVKEGRKVRVSGIFYQARKFIGCYPFHLAAGMSNH
jgi:hypothetical protein